MAVDAPYPTDQYRTSRRTRATPVAVAVIAAVCALLLVIPGETHTTKYVNDLLIFLDGAHRITVGQIPNRDFHTALGPLAFYIPAAGYSLTGSMGAAMPIGTALLILLVTPSMVHILDTRFRPFIAIPVAVLLVVILATPMNVGEAFTDLSFAMFYNRFGWALLGLLLMMYIHPSTPRGRHGWFDVLSASLIVLILCYLKISYGAVAIGFLALLLLDPRQRVWASLALVLVFAVGLVVEAFWRASASHIADILLAAKVSGAVRGSWVDGVNLILRNFVDYTFFGLLAGWSLRHTRSWLDLLFYAFCAVSGYVLSNQNYQAWGIITLYAGAAVATEKLVRLEQPGHPVPRSAFGLVSGSPLVLLGMTAPMMAISGLALGLHFVLGIGRGGEDFALRRFQDVKLANVASRLDYTFSAGYLNTLRNGADALASISPPAERVYVLDFVNPFSAGLDLQPPRGDTSWQHFERTFNRDHFWPPDEVLRNVDVVMEPKHPVERFTYYGLRDLYLPYVHANFELAAENINWWVWHRRS